jgi:hypothetical protein
MKRLVYSPSINVYIKSDYGIINLSDYITDFEVNRVIDAVSTASVTFRNPKIKCDDGETRFMFTEHKGDGGKIGPMIHPMDPIIITLTRLRGKPIQVFTGYCDTAPYVQLFPGVAKIDASCTLKRLLHTYWDPGLAFVQQFMASYGWEYDPATGDMRMPDANATNTKQLNDTGIGNLIAAMMNEIGGWQSEDIIIQPIPSETIEKQVGKIFDDLAKASKEDLKKYVNFLVDFVNETPDTQITGSSGGSSANTPPTQDTSSSGPGPAWIEALITKASKRYSVDKNLIRAVMRAESGFDPGSGSSAGAIGLMQLMPETARGISVDPYNDEQNVMGGARLLSDNLKSYNGDIPLALAAYNAGPGNVQSGAWKGFSETVNYVQKICAELGITSPV